MQCTTVQLFVQCALLMLKYVLYVLGIRKCKVLILFCIFYFRSSISFEHVSKKGSDEKIRSKAYRSISDQEHQLLPAVFAVSRSPRCCSAFD